MGRALVAEPVVGWKEVLGRKVILGTCSRGLYCVLASSGGCTSTGPMTDVTGALEVCKPSSGARGGLNCYNAAVGMLADKSVFCDGEPEKTDWVLTGLAVTDMVKSPPFRRVNVLGFASPSAVEL